MESPSLYPDQRDILLAFLDADVRFLTVGGFAFSAHAYIRATKDIDLWIDPQRENAGRVWRALTAYGAPLSDHQMTQTDFETVGLIYQMGLPPARVALLTSLADIDFTEAWEERIYAELAGLQVPFLGLRHLIRAKQIAGRGQDKLDVHALRRVQKRNEA